MLSITDLRKSEAPKIRISRSDLKKSKKSELAIKNVISASLHIIVSWLVTPLGGDKFTRVSLHCYLLS